MHHRRRVLHASASVLWGDFCILFLFYIGCLNHGVKRRRPSWLLLRASYTHSASPAQALWRLPQTRGTHSHAAGTKHSISTGDITAVSSAVSACAINRTAEYWTGNAEEAAGEEDILTTDLYSLKKIFSNPYLTLRLSCGFEAMPTPPSWRVVVKYGIS